MNSLVHIIQCTLYGCVAPLDLPIQHFQVGFPWGSPLYLAYLIPGTGIRTTILVYIVDHPTRDLLTVYSLIALDIKVFVELFKYEC